VKTEKPNSWLSFGANVGVIIGLVLVAYQINQEAELTKVQLFSEATSSGKEFNQAIGWSGSLIAYWHAWMTTRDSRLLETGRA